MVQAAYDAAEAWSAAGMSAGAAFSGAADGAAAATLLLEALSGAWLLADLRNKASTIMEAVDAGMAAVAG